MDSGDRLQRAKQSLAKAVVALELLNFAEGLTLAIIGVVHLTHLVSDREIQGIVDTVERVKREARS